MFEKIGSKRKNPWITIVVSAIICICLWALFLTLFHHYEDGIIAINAEEQDGYVKLVTDQIRLQKDQSQDEIVSNILSSLDASNSRYWTFADDGSIVFIKNTLETNQYQSISAESYFSGLGEPDFLGSLRSDKVSHQILTLADEKYIASGILFSYGGKNYQLVLLSSVAMILENNVFLEAKTELYSVVAIVLVILFLLPVIHAYAFNKAFDRAAKAEKEEANLRRILEKSNTEKIEKKVLDPQENIFPLSSLRHALQSIAKSQEAFPLLIVIKPYKDEQSRNDFLKGLEGRLTSRDLLFDDPKRKLIALLAMATSESDELIEEIRKNAAPVQILAYDNSRQLMEAEGL